MRPFHKAFCTVLIALFLLPNRAWADDAAILARIEALEEELKVLKRQLEVKKEEEDKKTAEAPVVTANAKDGFSLKSTDDSFKLRLRGILQLDSRNFLGNKKDIGTTDTFIVRRARPIFEGQVYERFDFYLMPDFGSSSSVLTDGWVEHVHAPEFKWRAGKFKEPFSLERLQSDSVSNFIEAGLTSNLAPNRDVGVMLHGELWEGVLGYQLGAFNGTPDNGSATSADIDTNNDKDVAARVFSHPWKDSGNEALNGLGLGLAATHGHKEGSSLPTYRSPGQVQVFTFNSGVTADGPHTRFSPQAYWYRDQVGVLAEYLVTKQQFVRGTTSDKYENTAWQVSGTYVLTGEDASYKGVKPRKPFDISLRQWGAFEIALRYGMLDLDDELFDKGLASRSAGISGQDAWAVGLNWYLNNSVRLMLDFERTDFDGGGPNGEDRENENVILTRFQIAY